MRWRTYFMLVFTLLTACHSGGSAPDNNGPSPHISKGDPFDRHGRLIFTKHARCRMDCRHITTHEIEEILDKGTINYGKSEPDARPDPKYAVEGYSDEQQHLRIIIAPEGEKLIVITCIELGVEWSCNCK